jgi:ATP-dependent DNA helicase RecG
MAPKGAMVRRHSLLSGPVSTVRGVGPDGQKLLERIGIRTVEDLLWHLPRGYVDYSKIVPLRSLRAGQEQTTIAVVGRIGTRRTARGQLITEMELRDEDGTPTRHSVVFFGNQFVKQRFMEGQRVRISGKVRPKFRDLGLTFDKPKIEPADREAVHTGRIVPVYRLTEGLKEGHLRRWLHTAVEGARDRSGKVATSPLVDHVPDPLPTEIRERRQLPTIVEALKQVHFPDDPMALFRARRRLGFDELLTLQLATAQRRARWAAEARAIELTVADRELEAWTRELPFALTSAQRRALGQIRADLARAVPMSRLLEGDVGSGKTVVAALAMRIAMRSGAQSAFMPPPELRAAQHFDTRSALFERGGPTLEKLTASVPRGERERTLDRARRGELDAVVGTHALLEEDVEFKRFALAVIDEQHRFGVGQRSTLREKGLYPHVLLTTATPIPQTLWQTLNRDLDVSILDEMPAGRQEIKTEVRTPDSLPRLWPWVKMRVGRGEQAFVVCPRIDPSDDPTDGGRGSEGARPPRTLLFDPREAEFAPSAVAMEEDLRRGPLKDVRVGLVHGRVPQKERDVVMTRFRDREIDVLVATTVVEVGIDIPNATVMVVLGAERFGLAQLHQLRGRVGRGATQSFCVLVSPQKDSDRLAAMTETVPDERASRGSERASRGSERASWGSEGAGPPHRLLNGFELAKRDLQIRGPGQFLGQEQSGFADQLRVVDIMDIDPKLLDDASAEADRVIGADPDLERAEHRGLRDAVDELWRRYAYA